MRHFCIKMMGQGHSHQQYRSLVIAPCHFVECSTWPVSALPMMHADPPSYFIYPHDFFLHPLNMFKHHCWVYYSEEGTDTNTNHQIITSWWDSFKEEQAKASLMHNTTIGSNHKVLMVSVVFHMMGALLLVPAKMKEAFCENGKLSG